MAKNSALTWIIKEAKKLKRDYPRRFSKWTDYVAQASAIYASKHKGKSPVGKKRVGATKFIEKGETPRTPAKVYKRVRDNKGHFKSVRVAGVDTVSKTHTDKNRITANIQIGSVAYHKKAIRGKIEHKLAGKLLEREKATLKRDKRKLTKEISGLKSELKKYS
jgi:hypothetical protein